MRSGAASNVPSASLAWQRGRAKCDSQLGTHHSYARTYPLPYNSAAAAFFFLRFRFFFAGAAGGASSLIPVWKSTSESGKAR